MSKDGSQDASTSSAGVEGVDRDGLYGADLDPGSPSQLEREIEETRERLAGTIDQLVHRANPKNIAAREMASVKGYFMDPLTGQPRTENILKVAGGVVGTVLLFVVIRRATR